MVQKKNPKIEPMDNLELNDEDFREDIIRVIKYGIQHAMPPIPDKLRSYLMDWLNKEEAKIDKAEGRETMAELMENNEVSAEHLGDDDVHTVS